MHRIATLLVPLLTLAAQPLAAQEIAYEPLAAETPGPEADLAGAIDASEELDLGLALPTVEVSSGDPANVGTRFVHVEPAPTPEGIAAYGPFRVLDGRRAALVGVTDAGSPAAFAAMLRDHPGIATLEMVACPGTEDDRANLRVGLMIRRHGIATHVPDGGFVGSGAVELFVAGVRRMADPTAEFAVHSWEDDSGREAKDYAPDAPENRAYLDYYEAVGFTANEAQAFYAMTNSVPFEAAKWLTRTELGQWVRLDSPAPTVLAVLDSAPTLQ